MTSDGTAGSTGALLFARLQLALPQGRTFLVTSPRALEKVEEVGAQLASEAHACGRKVRLLLPEGGSAPTSPGAEVVRTSPNECMEGRRVRELLAGDDYVVVPWDNLLGSAAATILAACVDGVVVVARRGRTAQADLTEVRLELERSGGCAVAAVLLG